MTPGHYSDLGKKTRVARRSAVQGLLHTPEVLPHHLLPPRRQIQSGIFDAVFKGVIDFLDCFKLGSSNYWFFFSLLMPGIKEKDGSIKRRNKKGWRNQTSKIKHR